MPRKRPRDPRPLGWPPGGVGGWAAPTKTRSRGRGERDRGRGRGFGSVDEAAQRATEAAVPDDAAEPAAGHGLEVGRDASWSARRAAAAWGRPCGRGRPDDAPTCARCATWHCTVLFLAPKPPKQSFAEVLASERASRLEKSGLPPRDSKPCYPRDPNGLTFTPGLDLRHSLIRVGLTRETSPKGSIAFLFTIRQRRAMVYGVP